MSRQIGDEVLQLRQRVEVRENGKGEREWKGRENGRGERIGEKWKGREHGRAEGMEGRGER